MKTAFLIIAGLALTGYGLFLGPGDLHLPGPGLWPACLGLVIVFAGLSFWIGPKPAPGPSHNHPVPLTDRRPLRGFAFSCVAWVILLPLAGWIPATALALFAAAWSAGNKPGICAILTTSVLALFFFAFELVMPRSLPEGLLFSLVQAP